MKYLQPKQALKLGIFFLSTVSLASLGACNSSVEDVCSHRLPELDRKLDAAVAALAPWTEPDRALASGEPARLAEVDREAWREWAQTQLTQAQHDMDAVEELPVPVQVREELSEIATALVSFHGYARQGKGERMVRTLELIRSHISKARELACPARKAASDAAISTG